MLLIVKISFRNLFRHRGRSLLTGAILFIGALIMASGNGIISGMEKGLESSIVDKWTGHILILSSRQKNDDALFSPKPLKVIKDYRRIEKILEKSPDLHSFLPATKGIAMVLNIGDKKKAARFPVLCMLLGVDFQKYNKMFNNISIIEGGELQAGEKGILINRYEREKIFDSENIWLIPKKNMAKADKTDPAGTSEKASGLVLMGIGDENSALDVYSVVKGIYKFNSLNLLFKEINIIDLESFRECFEYVTRADSKIVLSGENIDILESSEEELENYFSDNIVKDDKVIEKGDEIFSIKKEIKPAYLNQDTGKGVYNLAFVKIRPGKDPDSVLENLNRIFNSEKADARAVSWRDAAGYISDIALFFRIALNIFVFFIFFAAVIIIINTLSMTTMERIPEIGTMRAIGAGKGHIAKMFIAETSLLSFAFGGAGLVCGLLASVAVSGLEIPAANEMMSLAFGGDIFRPVPDLKSIINVIIQLILVTLASILYPLHLAVKISPLDAVLRD